MYKRLVIAVALTLLVGMLGGCTSTSGKESDTIKVGLDYEITGDVATYGQSITDGIELGIEEINKNGGVLGKQLEPIKVDNKSENAEAASVAARLINKNKVVAILGAATSGNTKAVIPVATQSKIPLISCSATDDNVTVDSNGKVREYVFKTCFSDSYQGTAMANFAYKDLNFRKAATLVDNASDYSKGMVKSFKETFTELGGTVVSEQAYQSGEKDFKAVLTRIKSENPDVLYIPGYYEEVGLIIKQARELDLNVPILGGDGYDSPKLAELAEKDALNDVYYTNHYSSKDTSPEVEAFNKAFKAKYNKEPDGFNALGYDLAYFFADALTRAGEVNSEKLKEALASTENFEGVTGKFSMGSNHVPVKSITVIKMVDGEPTFLKKIEPTE